MYSSLPSFVLAFHGCDKTTGEKVLSGKARLASSSNDYDWLGHGIYFWENNPKRALDFAKEYSNRRGMPKIKDPFVLGAIIDLGHCMNLLDAKFLGIVKEGYELLRQSLEKINKPLPKNKAPLNDLDCAVIQAVHAYREREKDKPFDTVRAAFTEGNLLYPDAAFQEKNHIQVCVRSPNCIKGYFRLIDPAGDFEVPGS